MKRYSKIIKKGEITKAFNLLLKIEKSIIDTEEIMGQFDTYMRTVDTEGKIARYVEMKNNAQFVLSNLRRAGTFRNAMANFKDFMKDPKNYKYRSYIR